MKRIVRTDTFKKCYKKLPPDKKEKVKKQIALLLENPKHPSLKVHLIKGTERIWECYVDRSYRMTFEIRGQEIILRVVGPHDVIREESKKKK